MPPVIAIGIRDALRNITASYTIGDAALVAPPDESGTLALLPDHSGSGVAQRATSSGGVEVCQVSVNIDGERSYSGCAPLNCGDGVLDPGEVCDLGAANSNAPDALCRSDCTAQRCGDGIVDPSFGEICDDGNNVAGDGCDPSCQSVCGDGRVDLGEECDDGNTIAGDGCEPTCKITANYDCFGAPSFCASLPTIIRVGLGDDISQIANGAAPGSTLFVSAGIYPYTQQIKRDNASLNIIGAGADQTLLISTSHEDAIEFVGTTQGTIQGVQLSSLSNHDALTIKDDAVVTVTDAIMGPSGDQGIDCRDQSKLTVRRVLFTGNTDEGLKLKGCTFDVRHSAFVDNGFVKGVDAGGVAVHIFRPGSVFRFNTISYNLVVERNAATAIWCKNGQDAVIEKSILWGSVGVGSAPTTMGCDFSSNDNDVEGGLLGNLNIDPMLSVDGYHLRAGSPMRTTTSVLDSGDARDVDLDLRHSGPNQASIGADE